MKKRLFGLVAMMLAAMIFVLAFPVQVKAETNYEFKEDIDIGDRLPSGVQMHVSGNVVYHVDNTGTYSNPYYLNDTGHDLFLESWTHDSESYKIHIYLVTTLKSNSSTAVTVPKLSPEQQAILKYNDAWDKVQKEYADETQMPVEPFMSAQAIASVPETVKNNSTAIANLTPLKTVPGVMALINKAQKVTAGDKVAIYTENPMTFSKEGYEAISSQNKTVIYAFKIDGVLYQITIPAGAKVDFGDNTYVGPLWIGAQLGTTAILE